jgi:hypothetical protein
MHVYFFYVPGNTQMFLHLNNHNNYKTVSKSQRGINIKEQYMADI